jgi:phospholipid-binding lipoprotein MlaA
MGDRRSGRRAWAAAVVLMVGLGAGAPARAENDPFEPFNRRVFAFNEVVDGLILAPAAELYGLIVPSPARRGVRNFLDNLRAPVVFANDLLQGERERAGNTISRLLINTLLGGLGIFDVATVLGHPRHSEDFGQTLGVWGVGEGPFLVLPILGPSNPRDALGIVVDGFVINPAAYVAPTEWRIGAAATDGVDTRYRLGPALDDVRANALDPYATFRTVYRQRRAAEIRNSAAPIGTSEYDDIFADDPDDE